MNKSVETASIQFMRHEEKVDRSMSFLDGLFTHKDNGSVMSTVYCKSTHMDHYFTSYHPQHQKIGVVGTLITRCEMITSFEADNEA